MLSTTQTTSHTVAVPRFYLNKLLVESVRYNLDRMTYSVSECCDIVKQYWAEISDGTKSIIRRDLSEEIEHHFNTLQYRKMQAIEGAKHTNLGMQCDVERWIELKNWIDEQEKGMAK